MSERYVKALYDAFDVANHENVIPFRFPLDRDGEEMLEDMQALLEDPMTRKYAADILRQSLQIIGAHFVTNCS